MEAYIWRHSTFVHSQTEMPLVSRALGGRRDVHPICFNRNGTARARDVVGGNRDAPVKVCIRPELGDGAASGGHAYDGRRIEIAKR